MSSYHRNFKIRKYLDILSFSLEKILLAFLMKMRASSNNLNIEIFSRMDANLILDQFHNVHNDRQSHNNPLTRYSPAKNYDWANVTSVGPALTQWSLSSGICTGAFTTVNTPLLTSKTHAHTIPGFARNKNFFRGK